MDWYNLLACPHCGEGFDLSGDGKTLTCGNRHSFDRAKQGYFHLLPVNQQKSKAPGDSKEMVLARKSFLGAGHYRPIVDGVLKAISEQLAGANTGAQLGAKSGVRSDKEFSWLDAGCGEGYYTEAIAAQYPQAVGLGLDISKPAIQKAAKLNSNSSDYLHWLVASSAKTPLKSNGLDLVLSLFSRLMPEESIRILNETGVFIAVNSGKDHLKELKARLYDQPKDSYLDAEKKLMPWMEKVADHSVKFTISLDKSEDIANLLLMTPHYWRAQPDKKAALIELTQIDLTVDVKIECFKPLRQSE